MRKYRQLHNMLVRGYLTSSDLKELRTKIREFAAKAEKTLSAKESRRLTKHLRLVWVVRYAKNLKKTKN
jgi:aminoglycoside phosphotransferase family enzyme